MEPKSNCEFMLKGTVGYRCVTQQEYQKAQEISAQQSNIFAIVFIGTLILGIINCVLMVKERYR